MPDVTKSAYVRELLDMHDNVSVVVNQRDQLQAFRKAVEAAIPGCRTTPYNNMWCWVYMPEDHVAMGAIGYGNFSNNGRGASTYAVASRTIANRKYGNGTEQYCTVKSVSIGVSVKSAKKYLRKHSPKELVERTKESIREAVNKMRNNAVSAISQSEVDLFGGGLPRREKAPLLAEMRYLLNSGHKFLDPTVPAKLTEYFALLTEEQNTQGRVNMDFVAVSMAHGKQRFDVVPVDKVDYHWPTIGEPQSFYDDVPEDIIGRLAVLSMVEDGAYVPGVGLRHTEGIFYVAR